MEHLKSFSPIGFAGKVTADLIFLKNNQLELKFTWNPQWPLKGLAAAREKKRTDEIWKSTCFEAFLQPTDKKSYWEINVAPSGAWNVYEFTDYRKPTPPIPASHWLLQEIDVSPGNLFCRFQADFEGARHMHASLCCILEFQNKEKSYWAVQHASPQPDYHQAKSFVLERNVP